MLVKTLQLLAGEYLYIFFTLAPLPVTIKSDAGIIVCVNTTITLACAAPNATDFKWTTDDDHIEVTKNNTDTIAVTATPEAIQYTCIATSGEGNAGRSSVFVGSNGTLDVMNVRMLMLLLCIFTLHLRFLTICM